MSLPKNAESGESGTNCVREAENRDDDDDDDDDTTNVKMFSISSISRVSNKRRRSASPPDNRKTVKNKVGGRVGGRLGEEDVGITELIGSHKRLAGILKERFGDFRVNEISTADEICKLTNQEIPPRPEELQDTDVLEAALSPETREKLREFTRADGETRTVEFDASDMNKETRRCLHAIAKKIPSVVGETLRRGTKKIIVLEKRDGGRDERSQDRRVDWTPRNGNYCHFVLHKVNMDTMEALNRLAVKLRLRSDCFHYAGTKDRRACTSQWISVKKVCPAKIQSAARQVRGAYVGNFKFSKDPLKLGALNGNRFAIALRCIGGSDREIQEAMTSLRDNGFINYYGLQRFGTFAAIPTHEIGKALLQGEWARAIDLILRPRHGEQQREMIEARNIYRRTKDAKLALRPIARSGKIEAKLLHGIINSGDKNPVGALDHIPRNARLMYIHAYQSFVWNRIVSRRIARFGAKPIVGDLVFHRPGDESECELADCRDNEPAQTGPRFVRSSESEEKLASSVSEDKTLSDVQGMESLVDETTGETMRAGPRRDSPTEISTRNDGSCERPGIDAENEMIRETTEPSCLPRVRPLVAEDLVNYSLADIVMPKPGWRVTYPSYATDWFQEFLAKDGLTMDLRQKNKKYSLGGGYRKILETPRDTSWKIVRYCGYHDDLIRSDIDEMRGSEPLEDKPDGQYRALIVEFSLGSSTYATMALREILGYDTSPHTQAAHSAANRSLELGEEPEKIQESADAFTECHANTDNLFGIEKI